MVLLFIFNLISSRFLFITREFEFEFFVSILLDCNDLDVSIDICETSSVFKFLSTVKSTSSDLLLGIGEL